MRCQVASLNCFHAFLLKILSTWYYICPAGSGKESGRFDRIRIRNTVITLQNSFNCKFENPDLHQNNYGNNHRSLSF